MPKVIMKTGKTCILLFIINIFDQSYKIKRLLEIKKAIKTCVITEQIYDKNQSLLRITHGKEDYGKNLKTNQLLIIMS